MHMLNPTVIKDIIIRIILINARNKAGYNSGPEIDMVVVYLLRLSNYLGSTYLDSRYSCVRQITDEVR